MSVIQPEEMTRHFHSKIPISREMGVRVLAATSRGAQLSVPLAPNVNHVQTGFGGSLYSAAALSCYALFLVISHEVGGMSDELVIQDGQISYLRPVKGDFLVESFLSDENDVNRFTESLQRRGRARLRLTAKVLCQGLECAVFTGSYVFNRRRGTHQ